MRRLSALLALGVLALGCAGVRPAAKFEGHSADPVARAEQIREEPVLPDGYAPLGRVSARCTLTQAPSEVDGEWLSDVDCTERRLKWAMRERAAEVGGELLVGLRCYAMPNRSQERVRMRCGADVARAGEELRARRPLTARSEPRQLGSHLPGLDPQGVERLDEPSASDAWRIKVRFVPAEGTRPARRADQVRELSELPVSYVALGDVSTRCEKGCSRESARHGLRLAAARMGARALVAVRCTNRELGWQCVGTAADYEVDPDRNARAR